MQQEGGSTAPDMPEEATGAQSLNTSCGFLPGRGVWEPQAMAHGTPEVMPNSDSDSDSATQRMAEGASGSFFLKKNWEPPEF